MLAFVPVCLQRDLDLLRTDSRSDPLARAGSVALEALSGSASMLDPSTEWHSPSSEPAASVLCVDRTLVASRLRVDFPFRFKAVAFALRNRAIRDFMAWTSLRV